MNNNQIIWATRRGMLELDMLLEPFARNYYPTADAATKRQFVELLSEQDQDLFNWFIGKEQAPERIAKIVAQVLQFNKK